jgi:hypothetical protein
MGIFPIVLPRLADGGGKRRGNCLRAKPEFFRVPPSARSKGSPQGQDWLGCLFLVSSFGHAKEEKENGRKASRLSPEFPDEPFLNPPQSPFVKGGSEECGRLGLRTVLTFFAGSFYAFSAIQPQKR